MKSKLFMLLVLVIFVFIGCEKNDEVIENIQPENTVVDEPVIEELEDPAMYGAYLSDQLVTIEADDYNNVAYTQLFVQIGNPDGVEAILKIECQNGTVDIPSRAIRKNTTELYDEIRTITFMSKLFSGAKPGTYRQTNIFCDLIVGNESIQSITVPVFIFFIEVKGTISAYITREYSNVYNKLIEKCVEE